MKTLLTKSIKRAADFIQKGQVVAFPTETVYGLGANAFDTRAVERIFKAKGRPSDNPLIVHIASINEVFSVSKSVPPIAQKLFQAFSPGPLTIILKKNDLIPHIVSAGLPTVGVRIPAYKLARDLIKHAQCPLAAPSANISGSPSATSWQHVLNDFNSRIPCILQGGVSQYGVESTVVDCTGKHPKILRTGAITREQIEAVIGNPVKKSALGKVAVSKSPGVKYRHYAPKAQVQFYSSKKSFKELESGAYIGLSLPRSNHRFQLIKICKDLNHYAHELYRFFRECDQLSIPQIYCERPTKEGLGATILDRLTKAVKK